MAVMRHECRKQAKARGACDNRVYRELVTRSDVSSGLCAVRIPFIYVMNTEWAAGERGELDRRVAEYLDCHEFFDTAPLAVPIEADGGNGRDVAAADCEKD